MGRVARVVVPGLPHHVVQRGVRSMDIFESDGDRRAYLGLLSKHGKQHGLSIWGWCLMTNHIHLVAVPAGEESMALAFGLVHRKYAQRVNERHGVRGHLFQERYYSYPVQLDSSLLSVVRYVELNPVNAGLVARPEEYLWSSARSHVTGGSDAIIESSPIRAMAADWGQFLRDGIEMSEERARIERHLRTGLPFGEIPWVRQMEKHFGRRLTSRHRGRPRLGETPG